MACGINKCSCMDNFISCSHIKSRDYDIYFLGDYKWVKSIAFDNSEIILDRIKKIFPNAVKEQFLHCTFWKKPEISSTETTSTQTTISTITTTTEKSTTPDILREIEIANTVPWIIVGIILTVLVGFIIYCR